MAREMGFCEDGHPGDAAGVRELMPAPVAAGVEVEVAHQPREQRLQRRQIAQAIRRASVGVDDPLGPGHGGNAPMRRILSGSVRRRARAPSSLERLRRVLTQAVSGQFDLEATPLTVPEASGMADHTLVAHAEGLGV